MINSSLKVLDACLAGVGLAQVTEVHAQEHIGSGALAEVLAGWSELFSSCNRLANSPLSTQTSSNKSEWKKSLGRRYTH